MDGTTRYSTQTPSFEEHRQLTHPPIIDSNVPTEPEQARVGAPSPGRPRHDNDRCHITGIHILPTYREITSGAGQYLPSADPATWHLPGAIGRFDREFRLLRENTAGQIRDACQEVLQAVRGPGIDTYRRQRTSTYFGFCDDAKIQRITMRKERGIEFTVACKQPAETGSMTDEERQAWWERCKRFRPGTAVCVLDTADVLHFVVSESTVRGPWDAPDELYSIKFNLTGDRDWFYVKLKLSDPSKLCTALRWYRNTDRMRNLLDFADLTLDSFKYTLEALQRECQSPHRLISLLNTDSPDRQSRPVVERPAYTPISGFEFKLDYLVKNGQTFQFDPRRTPTPGQVSSFADLDPEQATAFIESLSTEVAIIDGRRGTGKSYLARKIIKILVHNRENADIGPVICVSHNDSALDSMIDQLLDDGIERIVRMGGHSDSERLRSLNLPATNYPGMSSQERQAEEQMSMFLDKLVEDIDTQLLRLSNIELPRPSDELRHWSYWDRRQDYQDYLVEDLSKSYKEYEEIRAEIPRFHDDNRRQVLQEAQVVAVTITELARSPELLQTIHAKVLVCDDAGEFLESQTLTAILPSTEHIILFGDHNQLPPTVRTEQLQPTTLEGVANPLDFSLFHRIIDDTYHRCPRLSPSTLNTQHRMPSSIARVTSQIGDMSLRENTFEIQCPRHPGEAISMSGPDQLNLVPRNGMCSQPCGRQLGCGHFCQRSCHDSECGPCQQSCDVRCPHSECTMPCAVPCNWVPCSRRCTLLLDCGHQCPSLCGEACPQSKYCQTCGTDDVLHTVVDSTDMKDYKDINLDEDPCIFPRCGHFQTRSSMDQRLKIQDFYDLSEEGVPCGIKGALRPFSIQRAAGCTQCNSSLRDISRYGRIIRRPILDESVKGFLTWSNAKFFDLARHLHEHSSNLRRSTDYRYNPASSHHQSLSIELNGNIQSQIHVLRDFVGEGRYTDLTNWYRDIQNFRKELNAKEVVFQKVAELTRRANERLEAAARSTGAIHQHEPFVQLNGDLVAMNLSLRCSIAILADFLRIWKEEITSNTSPRPSLQFHMTSNFRGSQTLIKRAYETHRPLLAAQGHVYFALLCGFALAFGVETLTQILEPTLVLGRCSEEEMPEFPFTHQDLRSKGLQNITKASDILAGSSVVKYHLIDEIETTKRFIHEGCLDKEAGGSWYVAVTETLVGTSLWHACDNGHPFMEPSPDFMSQEQQEMRCPECDLTVAGHRRACGEEAQPDREVNLSCYEETLVEI